MNNQESILVNQFKRKSLKTIASAAAGMTAVGLSPISLAAGQSFEGEAALSITHTETVFGHTVFIENLSDETIKLESLNPGRFSTASGEFDMNRLLQDRSLEIQPATTQAHNVSEDGRVHNWAVWNTIESTSNPLVTRGRVRPVNIYVYDPSLSAAPKKMIHSGRFA